MIKKKPQEDLASKGEVWFFIVPVNDTIISHLYNFPSFFSSNVWQISYKRAYELPAGFP